MNQGSEDVEVQCQTSVPCESSSYGIATVPFVASVARTGTPVSGGTVMLAQSGASHTPPQNVAVQPSVAASPLPHVGDISLFAQKLLFNVKWSVFL